MMAALYMDDEATISSWIITFDKNSLQMIDTEEE